MRYKKLLVTGGSGFVGSAFIRWGLSHFPLVEKIVNLDLLTYAAHVNSIPEDSKYIFVKGNVCNGDLVHALCVEHEIEAIVHFAAESHVDRSLLHPKVFVDTNIYGTFSLLEVVRKLPHIHFHHISTDEVYGSLEEGFFTENSAYNPSSPYSATKAASDHLVRAWAHSFGISTTLSHCTNNYGPYQYEEKLIPRIILNCLKRKPLPIYGKGLNIRDWIYVDDHAQAVWTILEKGKKREVYDIGGDCEKQNISLVHEIIEILAPLISISAKELYGLITFVADRKGHDLRYAIDSTKIKTDLGWIPSHTFSEGLKKTIIWYYEENCLCHSC